VEADDAALEIVRLENRRKLGEAQKPAAEQHAAFDDRALDLLDQPEDLVAREEAREILPRHIFREILELLGGRAGAVVEVILERRARGEVEAGLRPRVVHGGRD